MITKPLFGTSEIIFCSIFRIASMKQCVIVLVLCVMVRWFSTASLFLPKPDPFDHEKFSIFRRFLEQ